MWPSAKRKAKPELLDLFAAAGENVEEACGLLRDLVAGFPEADGLAERIRDHEHAGDRLSHEILQRVARSDGGGDSLDPADVHALASALDDIVDYAEEAADQLGLYGVEATTEQSLELAEVLARAAGVVAVALDRLRADAEPTEQLAEIHRLEDEGDLVVRRAVASLFAQGIDPMVVIRWKAIYDTLEAAVDACETVANVLEGIVLKREH